MLEESDATGTLQFEIDVMLTNLRPWYGSTMEHDRSVSRPQAFPWALSDTWGPEKKVM